THHHPVVRLAYRMLLVSLCIGGIERLRPLGRLSDVVSHVLLAIHGGNILYIVLLIECYVGHTDVVVPPRYNRAWVIQQRAHALKQKRRKARARAQRRSK